MGIRQFLDVGPGLPTRNTHHVVPALRGQQREQIAAALAQRFIQEQVSIRDLASELGRRLSLVRRLLDEAAVCAETTSCVGVPKSEVAAVLAARYREGVPTERLSDDTGIDRRVVRRMLTGEGVSPPERHPLSVETGYYHD
ncbi:MAG: helix-turn-helix domain-containing protein [Pseudonocardiaceae bacterium]